MTKYAFAVAAETFDWDESKHPRGGDEAHPGRFSEAEGSGSGTKDDPIRTSDPTEAAKALGEGKYVELDQPRTLSTTLDEIVRMVDDAKAKGEKAPTYNLCNATVEGTNLFCVESQGIPRVRMPQLSGKPEPGSWADENLPRNERGEVDAGPAFVKYLEEERGINVSKETVPADVLRASQNELDGVKVAGMVDAIEGGTYTPASIFVTKDDYVVDGHHRWAAEVAEGYTVGQRMQMPVQVIDAPILKVLAIANNWTTSHGLPHAAVDAPLVEKVEASGAFDETAHPRDDHGKFTDAGGGSGDVTHVDSVGDVDQFLAANPREAGEPSFVYQSRIVQKLDPVQRHELLFALRERYPPVAYIAAGAERYRAEHGLPDPKVDVSTIPAPLEKGDRVARAFENTADQSDDPKVQAAYADFKRQNEEMYAFVTKPESEGGLGIKIDFSPYNAGEAYHSAAAQAADLRDNHHITTQSGLGGDHLPLLTTDEYDRFRAVHDIFGHAGVGGGFDRHGEYEAWLEHRTMYTGPGADAMSSEYHGVNTAVWAGEKNSPGEGTGKSILLPERLIRDPWDENGNYVRAMARTMTFSLERPDPALLHLAEKLGLDSSFPAKFDHLPWHYRQDQQLTAGGDFDESKHPRDEKGRFGEGDGGGKKKKEGEGAGTKDDPVYTKHPKLAVKLLGEGKYVELDQPRRVSTMLDRIGKIVADAQKHGEQAPTYNLCHASVAGTNLFCEESKGIPRVMMPQLKGTPEEGSWADKNLPKDKHGEVNLGPAFIDELRSRGIATESTTAPANVLRATQNELDGARVAEVADKLESGKKWPGSIYATSDDYIVDGHHHWAADIGIGVREGRTVDVKVQRIDAPILQVLAIADNFTESRGLPHKRVGENLTASGDWDESKHPRGEHGRFGDGGGSDAVISIAGQDIALKGSTDGKGTPDDPIYVGKDLDRAIQLLAQDKSIRLDDEKVASVLVSKLGDYSQDFRDKGEKAPNFDLCNVTVTDTNLFCGGNQGIARGDMPQLRSTAEDGSIAAEKRTNPENTNEYVTVEPEYHEALRNSGVDIRDRTVDASMLRASQNEINGGKAGRMLNAMIAGERNKPWHNDPIWVTKDGYVLDGHHRWAATLARSILEGGDVGRIKVHEVGMDIGAAVNFTRRFTEHVGLRKMDATTFRGLRLILASGAFVTFEYREEDHPRGEHGRWESGGGASNREEDSKQLAKAALEVAREHEPAITADMVDVAGQVDGTMTSLGIPGRSPLKSEGSLAKKIERDLVEKDHGQSRQEIADQIHDNVRYTMTFPGTDYAASAQRAIDTLTARGYEIAKFKNTWLPEDRPYRGINIQARNPDGYQFELQMHTPSSFEAKTENHVLFDAVRDLPTDDPVFVAAGHMMQDRAMEVAMPIGADRLKA